MRSLLQYTQFAELSPEATGGFILGFCILGFGLALITAYATYLSKKLAIVEDRVSKVGLLTFVCSMQL
jgi:hypothetical protein